MLNNNIEILARVIIDDATREAENIIEKAKDESQSIKEKGIVAARELKIHAESNSFHARLACKKAKSIALAEFKARSEILRYKEEEINRILQQIQMEFFALPHNEEYPKILKRLIIDSLEALRGEGEEFIFRINASDRSILSESEIHEIGKTTGNHLAMDQTPAEIIGGVIVMRKDYRVIYDNSLESIFERKRQQMRYMAAECMFGEN